MKIEKFRAWLIESEKCDDRQINEYITSLSHVEKVLSGYLFKEVDLDIDKNKILDLLTPQGRAEMPDDVDLPNDEAELDELQKSVKLYVRFAGFAKSKKLKITERIIVAALAVFALIFGIVFPVVKKDGFRRSEYGFANYYIPGTIVYFLYEETDAFEDDFKKFSVRYVLTKMDVTGDVMWTMIEEKLDYDKDEFTDEIEKLTDAEKRYFEIIYNELKNNGDSILISEFFRNGGYLNPGVSMDVDHEVDKVVFQKELKYVAIGSGIPILMIAVVIIYSRKLRKKVDEID
jgi:hypothetical protein